MNAVNRLLRWALALGMLVMAGSAAAKQPREPEWFSTELAAVVAATSRYNPVSIREDREFLGAIVRDGECYAYTVGAGRRGSDRITVRIEIDTDADIVAFWHTHGAQRPGNRYFSDVDTRLVENRQKPLYLADYTGSLKIMRPGDRKLSITRARALGLPSKAGFAKGRIVRDRSGRPAKILTRL